MRAAVRERGWTARQGARPRTRKARRPQRKIRKPIEPSRAIIYERETQTAEDDDTDPYGCRALLEPARPGGGTQTADPAARMRRAVSIPNRRSHECAVRHGDEPPVWPGRRRRAPPLRHRLFLRSGDARRD